MLAIQPFACGLSPQRGGGVLRWSMLDRLIASPAGVRTATDLSSPNSANSQGALI